MGKVTLQIVRDGVVRFNAEGPDGLRDRKPAGPIPLLTDAHRAALLEIIERGPTAAISAGTRSEIGRDCRDGFLSLAKTCDKLGIAIWDYLGSRFKVVGATIIEPLELRQSTTPPRLTGARANVFVPGVHLIVGIQSVRHLCAHTSAPVTMPTNPREFSRLTIQQQV